MEPSVTMQNLKQSSLEESTISRQTRNAFITALIFTVAALINFVVSLQISFTTRAVISYLDSVVVLIFVFLTTFSAIVIRNGKKEKGIWLLLISLALTLALRNALIADLDIIFSVLVATIVPFIGLLTLKPKFFARVLSLGIFSSSFYLIFDILAARYLPPYRQLSENIELMVRTMTVAAVIIPLILTISLFRQHRLLLLSSKLTLSMVLIVLAPIIILSITSSVSLENSLIPRQTEEMRVKASFIAQNIDRYISTNKSALRSSGENASIINYLLMLQSIQENEESVERQALEEETLESLRSFRRKNILQINSYAILDISGENILDTSSENIGNNEGESNYFTKPLETGLPFVSDVLRTGFDEYSIYFSAPVHTLIVDKKTGFVDKNIGVIRAEYKLTSLQRFINDYVQTEEANKVSVFASLLSEKTVNQISPEDPASVYLILANSRNAALNLHSVTPLTTNVITPLQMGHILPPGSTAQLTLDVPGFDAGLRNRLALPVFEAQVFPRNSGINIPLDVIATAEVDEKLLSWIVVISQDLETFNLPFQQQSDTNTLLTIFIAIGAAFFAYAGSQYLTNPILRFANTANRVAKGDLNARIEVNSEDEIGALGTAFNSMTAQLDTLIKTLEERVAERTQALERSAQQLRAAVDVGSAAATLRDLDELLSQTTKLISRQFGFYHAGIFLIDPLGEYALLRAANSDGGLRMLARAHKLKVGEVGIVGYVTAKGEARIALDVGQDAAFFDNPDLPLTRSEMALPLIAGGKTLGALDIQSTKGGAFTEADIATLQVLADQIAIAIENARLFEENRKALATAQRAYGEQSHLGWQELIHKEESYGYRGSSDGAIYPLEKNAERGIDQATEENQMMLDENNLTANIPITVRGKSVGAIRLSKPENAESWDQKDLDLAEVLTAELSQVMDSARLFEETRQQADRERVVGEISNRMRETMNVESVIRLAADELYKLLDLEHITIHLSSADTPNEEEIA